MAATDTFETIYKEHYPRIWRICMGYAGGDADLARDLTQEVFIRVWENLSKFRGESQLSTWMYRIAVNTSLLELRRKKRGMRTVALEQLPEPQEANQPEEHREQAERIRRLYQAIEQLLPTNRTIALLELEGVPQKEIAEVTGLSHAAVRTRVHRIKNELLKIMKDGTI